MIKKTYFCCPNCLDLKKRGKKERKNEKKRNNSDIKIKRRQKENILYSFLLVEKDEFRQKEKENKNIHDYSMNTKLEQKSLGQTSKLQHYSITCSLTRLRVGNPLIYLCVCVYVCLSNGLGILLYFCIFIQFLFLHKKKNKDKTTF